MNINDFEGKLENTWLENVLKEVRKQLGEKHDFKEKFKKDALETQRELWQEVGSVSIANELEQLVDFLGYIDVMKRQKRSHELTERLQRKYERMVLSPYFGRIDFLENGDRSAVKRKDCCFILPVPEHFIYCVYTIVERLHHYYKKDIKVH